MKILTLILAVAFLALATGVFAAFIYGGHPYIGVNHHQNRYYLMEDNSGTFGGCPYLQELHKGVEPDGGDYSYHELEPWLDSEGSQEPSGESGLSPQQEPLKI